MQPDARIEPGERNGTGLPGTGVDGTRAVPGVPGTDPFVVAAAARAGLGGTSAGFIRGAGAAPLASRFSDRFKASSVNGTLSLMVFFSLGPMGNDGIKELGF
jgi:hypothetical protein